MSWANIDDAASYHPKARKAGLEAWGFYVAAIVYSTKLLKDGVVLDDALEDVWPWGSHAHLAKIAKRLEDAKLFDRIEGGWFIHDYFDHQRSRADVLAARAAEAERKRAARGQPSSKRPAGQTPDVVRTDARQTSDAASTTAGQQPESATRPPLACAPAPAILSYPSHSQPLQAAATPTAAASVGVSFGEPARLACALMLAHEALAPGAGSIAMPVRDEVGAALHGRAVGLRAEIDDGATVQALGDELVTHAIAVFREDPGSRLKGYPPGHLVTALRGDALARAADLVRHAHGKPVSRAWKGPQPAMRNLAEGEGSVIPELTAEELAAMDDLDRTGRTRSEVLAERAVRAKGGRR